jgi:hypothetical protein
VHLTTDIDVRRLCSIEWNNEMGSLWKEAVAELYITTSGLGEEESNMLCTVISHVTANLQHCHNLDVGDFTRNVPKVMSTFTLQ